ncbi:hypothetical protein EBZ39_11445 [bacterium]|nr:hypothetical protein [bacterium]
MSFQGNNTLIAGRKNPVFFLLNEDEWVKALHYNPATQTYSFYPTQSDAVPTPVTANSVGDGSAGQTGNFANVGNNAVWNNTALPTTVGTNGGPSYFGVFDGAGNINEWTEGISSTLRIRRGGSFGTSATSTNIGSRFGLNPANKDSFTGFRIGSYSYVNRNFVHVYTQTNSDVSNPGYTTLGTTFGVVPYRFYVSKYLVTNEEYCDFLNSVASGTFTDTYGLFVSTMQNTVYGGINKNTLLNTYSFKTNYNNKPVNLINWFSAARYCNWLTNGKPVGPQGLTTTEAGAYYLNGATSGVAITRNPR